MYDLMFTMLKYCFGSFDGFLGQKVFLPMQLVKFPFPFQMQFQKSQEEHGITGALKKGKLAKVVSMDILQQIQMFNRFKQFRRLFVKH